MRRFIFLLLLIAVFAGAASAQYSTNATSLRGWRLCNPIGNKTDGYALTWDGTNLCWKSAAASGSSASACAVTVGATPAIDATSCNSVSGVYDMFKLGPLAQNASPTFAHGVAGQPYSIMVYQGAGSAFTVTWPATIIGGCAVDSTLGNRTLLTGTMDSTGTNLLIGGCTYVDQTGSLATSSSGSFASIPSCTASLTNRIYFFTDAPYDRAICNGTSWTYLYQGQSVTPPNSNTWTSVNVNGSSSIETTHGFHWINAATDNASGYAWESTSVGTTFTKTFMLQRDIIPRGTSTVAYVLGAMVSDGSKVMAAFNYTLRATAVPTSEWGLVTYTNQAMTAGGANPAGADFESDIVPSAPFCIQVIADATHVTFYQAMDCTHFTQIYQGNVSFFGTAISKVGWGVSVNTVANHASLISYQ